jgi:hypothetical protein
MSRPYTVVLEVGFKGVKIAYIYASFMTALALSCMSWLSISNAPDLVA